MVHHIPLTKGLVAAVDAIDFRAMYRHKWHAFDNNGRGWYARTKIGGKRVFMHTLLIGALLVDHKDGNGLNNTRSNLRRATHQENARNRRKTPGLTSQFRGVYLLRPGVYRATIRVAGNQKSLGCFCDEVAAARAYDAAARELHGEFARLNFPDATPLEVKRRG